MAKIKGHTPGPWHTRGTLIEAPSKTVASLSKVSLQLDMEEAMANAKLLAAAPVMLAALKEIMDNCMAYVKADNMAGRLYRIASEAVRRTE